MAKTSLSLAVVSWHWLALLLLVLVWHNNLNTNQVAAADVDSGIISFPSTCNCSLTMSCSCCQGAIVSPLKIANTLCVTFKLNLFQITVDVSITMNGSPLSKFTIDFKNANMCVPLLNQVTPLAVCLKVSGKLSGLTAAMVCPSFYSSFSDNQIVALNFTCLKVGLTGITLV